MYIELVVQRITDGLFVDKTESCVGESEYTIQ